MADGPSFCRAAVCVISNDRFVELCQADLPFTEAVVLGGSGKLNVAENDGNKVVLACKTHASLSDPSTARYSQKELLLNACTSSTDIVDFQESLDGYRFRDWSSSCSDGLVLAVPEALSVLRRGHFSYSGQNEYLWVKKSTAIPLQKIFVGVTTDESYEWAERYLTGVLSRRSESAPILIRENDVLPLCLGEEKDKNLLLASKNLFVLQCEPVQQGLVTPNTSIIVSRMDAVVFKENLSEVTGEQNVDHSDVFTTFLISEFTYPVKALCSLDSLTNLNQGCITHKPHFKLKASVIPHPGIISTFKGVETIIADGCSRLYVTMVTLMSMGLFNGTWVKVWRQNADLRDGNTQVEICRSCRAMAKLNESCRGNIEQTFSAQKNGELGLEHEMKNGASTECCESQSNVNQGDENRKPAFHIVQLFAVSEGDSVEDSALIGRSLKYDSAKVTGGSDCEIKCHQGFLSPSLYFNLFGSIAFSSMEPRHLYMAPVESSVKRSWVQETVQRKDTRTNTHPTHPPFANEAHVALILSPVLKASDSFDEALARYFKRSRLLTVGDVFCVEWDWRDGSGTSQSISAVEEQKWRRLCVYFKVTKLVCERHHVASSFVDVEHTSLYQRGVIHSYAPVVVNAVDSLPLFKTSGLGCNTFEDLLNPPGLEGYVQNLIDVVKPYLIQSCTLPPTGILLTGPPGVGKRTVVKATGQSLCLHSFEINCYDLIGESVAATETRIRNSFQKGVSSSPCIMLMRNIHALGKDREGNEDEPRIALTMADCISKLQVESHWPVVVVATSSHPRDIATDLLPCFLHEVRMEAPSEGERRSILAGLMDVTSVAGDVSLRQLAKRTAGMVASDLTTLLSQASRVSTQRVLNSCANMNTSVKGANDSQFPWQLEQNICQAGVSILWKDLEQALEILQAAQSDAIGAAKIPSVKWEDVGGLADVKAEILDTVQLPLQHPELFAAGLRRSGVLLYGPPGTGKTLLAKAVATECSLNFLSVNGPELINMYVGQSEQNVREVFSRAQSARPCVIFFDELDSLAPNRGRSGDSGGVMDRVVSQLLAELDGLHKACDVFVIGATNRPDLLDPALLRPGRFDKMMYLGISEDRNAQLQILRALTRKFDLDSRFDLDEFVTHCPANLTGADFYALCSDAMLHSVKRKIQSLETGEEIGKDEVAVTGEDFKAALDNLVPSVTAQELKRYKQIQQEFTLAGSASNKKR